MGRVSKYKKIKSCDPYSKQNKKLQPGGIDLSTVGVWGLGDDGRKPKKRSRTAERLKAMRTSKKRQEKLQQKYGNNQMDGLDLPPSEKDEFDLSDLVGSVKKQKLETSILDTVTKDLCSATNTKEASFQSIVSTSTGNVACIPKSDHDETKVARLLKLDQQIKGKDEQKRIHNHQRMEGESKKAYSKRSKAETRQIIQNTTIRKNTEKLQKKKEFLKNKKKNKQNRKAGSDENSGYYEEDNLDFVTDDRAAATDEVRFGEQAERPPVFRQLPRGAKKTKHTPKVKELQSKNGMSQEEIQAESNSMERMRRRVQAQYAAIRSKRRDAGDGFHL